MHCTRVIRKGGIKVDKLIQIEAESGPYQMVLQRLLRMVPDRDKHDVELQRLLAFRLRIDGEGVTGEYLMRKVRDMIQCQYTGRLYEFLKDDAIVRTCRSVELPPDPPELA